MKEKKQTQTDIELLLSAVWNSSVDAMRITDSKGKIINVNNAYCKLIGLKKNTLIGKKFNVIYNKKDSIHFLKEYNEFLSSNKKFERKEKKLTFLNGKQYTLESSYSCIKLSGENYILGIFRNITERKKIEEKLRDREERYRLLAESSPEMVYFIDTEGIVKYVNSTAAAAFRLDAEEIVGKHLTEIFPLKTANEHLEKINKVIETKQKFYSENEEVFPTGKIWIEVRLSPVINKNGVVIGVLGLSYNITERKKAEEELRAIEKQQSLIFKYLPVAVYYAPIDPKVDTLWISENIFDITGFTSSEFTSTNNFWRKRIHPDDVKEVFKIYNNISDLQEINIEYRWKIKSGKYKWFLDKSILNKSRKGNEYFGVIIDITESKLVEGVEKSVRKQLRAVLDTVPSYIFAKDYDGKFLMVNKSLSDLFGVSPEEVVGKSDVDYGASKEQIEGYITADRKVIDSGEPLLISEEQVLRKDGSLGWFQTNKVPYQHPGTDKPAILGVAVDITERKNAEEKLKESEIKYKSLYNNAEVALFDSSIDSAIIINCNQKFCDLFGFKSPENAIGQSVLQLYVNPEHRDEIRKIITKSNYLNNYTVHFRNIKTDNKFYGHLTMRIEEDGDTFVGTIVDITKQILVEKEILNAKEKAEEMNRLKTNFLANMSHEIRTPLNGILGFARILEDELNNPLYFEYTNAIKTSGLRLLETLDLILSFSKLEAEKVDMHYSNMKIEDAINEVIFTFDILAKNKNLYLKTEIKDIDIITEIDERFLYQILNNLVNNAIKYTNEGGVIIELSRKKEEVIIKVKDTGIGIARNKFDIIFEEFRQESEGHGRSFEGTGLGLAITKKFVELMNGTIEVESEVGVGSTFTVKFPYIKAPESLTIKLKKEESEKQVDIPVLSGKDKLSVLIVEDDAMNLIYTMKTLKDHYIVDSAAIGLDALKKTKEKVYDIILMDINLGKGMNGIEAVRKMRKLPGYEKTPIVALTAFVLPGDREEFLKGGCTHYLGKPFTKNQILELLEKITDKK